LCELAAAWHADFGGGWFCRVPLLQPRLARSCSSLRRSLKRLVFTRDGQTLYTSCLMQVSASAATRSGAHASKQLLLRSRTLILRKSGVDIRGIVRALYSAMEPLARRQSATARAMCCFRPKNAAISRIAAVARNEAILAYLMSHVFKRSDFVVLPSTRCITAIWRMA